MAYGNRIRTLGSMVLTLMSVAACASPSERISDELGGYGMNSSQALCVGQRLERNLSLPQLQQLASAARALTRGDSTPGRFTAADLLRVASEIRDPEIAIEVAKAANGCAVLRSLF